MKKKHKWRGGEGGGRCDRGGRGEIGSGGLKVALKIICE